DSAGPWTCPKCGPLPARAQPLYGEDERHHCPNLDCDKIVTLLSKEDLEPTERRTGSWPPQRNKNRAPSGAAEDHGRSPRGRVLARPRVDATAHAPRCPSLGRREEKGHAHAARPRAPVSAAES